MIQLAQNCSINQSMGWNSLYYFYLSYLSSCSPQSKHTQGLIRKKVVISNTIIWKKSCHTHIKYCNLKNSYTKMFKWTWMKGLKSRYSRVKILDEAKCRKIFYLFILFFEVKCQRLLIALTIEPLAHKNAQREQWLNKT